MNTEFSSPYHLVFFDTETTGHNSDDHLCQLAHKTIGQTYDEMFDELFNPPLPIKIDAMAVHHIRQQQVDGKPLFKESDLYEDIKSLFENKETISIAHNIAFDVEMMRREDIEIPKDNQIDTLKIAQHLDPQGIIPRYAMQYLRYYLNLDDDLEDNAAIQAHDAKGDVIILELLFWRLFKKVKETKNLDDTQTIDEMIKMSQMPVQKTTFSFGKYKGQKIKDVAESDPGYLQWLLKQKQQNQAESGGEEDWIYTLERVLGISS